MTIEVVSIGEQIQESGSAKLERDAKGLLFTLKEQGGVDLEADVSIDQIVRLQHQLTSMRGIAELASNLRTSLFERAAQCKLADSSKSKPEPVAIANQDSFVRGLLREQPQLLKQLAEITAKAQMMQDAIAKQKDDEAVALTQEKISTWKHTIAQIAEVLARRDWQLSDWQAQIAKMKTELSQPTIKKGSSEKMKASYASRLEKVLSSDRGQSLVDVYLKPTQAEKLTDQLTDEYLATAFAVNGVRVLDRIARPGKTEDGQTSNEVDLVQLREQISRIFTEAETIKHTDSSQEEKSAQLDQLDQRCRDLLIPIANKVKQVFPHAKSTGLSDVLENEEAVCAGKVNVLLAATKYLGINARANTVKEMTNGATDGHVCFEADLPSGKKLIIDANFSNYHHLDGLTDEQIMAEIKEQQPNLSRAQLRFNLKYRRQARENAHYIPSEAEMLVYTAEPTGTVVTGVDQQPDLINQPGSFTRTDPYSGRQEVWQASVPYPHRATMPDKDGYMHLNSSFLNNSNTDSNIKTMISDLREEVKPPKDKNLARYLATKQIEINPYEPLAYLHLADAIEGPAKHEYLENMRQNRPEIYWQKMSLAHADSLAKNGDLQQALALFKGAQQHNPQFLINNLEVIRNIVNTYQFVYDLAPEAVDSFRQEAVVLIEQLKTDHPEQFFAKTINATILEGLHTHPEAKVALREEYQRWQEAIEVLERMKTSDDKIDTHGE